MPSGRIGKLTVLAELGAGAGSRVYHIRRAADSKEYALKVVPAGPGRRSKYLDQLRNEFRVGRMLDHPNLAAVYAFEMETDWLFRPRRAKLLLEYVPGRTIDRLPPQRMATLLAVFERVADALAHMHERGVCHGDLKPGNLALGPDAGVKVIDYGLARVGGESKVRVQGTPEYMAPETADRKHIDERTDVYNLGATMYHLVARRPLPLRVPGLVYDERSYGRLVAPVAVLNAEAPADLCDLIHWCISYNPASRPAGAGEVRAALSRLLAAWEDENPARGV
jgi:eukaryotic-like serine/threonine-protein kinase